MGRPEFLKLLYAIAQISNFQLNDIIVDLYEEALKKNGYPKLCTTLKYIFTNRKPRDSFPSIGEIQEIITPTLANVDLAKEASARIIAAISKFGRWNVNEAKGYIGELGWSVVKMSGGWSNLCEQVTMANTTSHIAQFRELAASLARKSELGIEDKPPALPVPKGPFMQAVKSLESKLSM